MSIRRSGEAGSGKQEAGSRKRPRRSRSGGGLGYIKRMLTRLRRRIAFILVLIVPGMALVEPVSLWAQAQPAAAPTAFAPADKLPFDSAVKTGALPNGLTYYIRRNTR